MSLTVLVASSSRHGATDELACALAATIADQGLAVDVRGMDEVDTVFPYDALVLGSAVYMGRWTAEARRFVDLHDDELAARRTWLFSSGPIGDPPKPDPDESVRLDEIVGKTAPEEHRVGGGKIDRKHLGLAERAVMRAVRAREGDYRDWRAIRGYAEEIAEAVNE